MIQKLINDKLLAEQEERNKRVRSGKFSPSLFGRCYRMQYWNRKGEVITNPVDERSLRIFKAGKLFHDFVQNLLTDYEKEVKVETDDILGYADIVLPDEVVDLKSQHSKAFWWMTQPNYDINKEKFQNILQVVTYAWLLKKPKARLVFISKDDLCILEYGFNMERWYWAIEEELNTLRDYWVKGLPPKKPRAYGIDKNKKSPTYGKPNECWKYCPYKNKCMVD